MPLGTAARKEYEMASASQHGPEQRAGFGGSSDDAKPSEDAPAAPATPATPTPDLDNASVASDDETLPSYFHVPDDASVSAETVSTYGEFVQYMDFLELVEFMGVLASKHSPPPINISKGDELEILMAESASGKGEGETSSLADFIDVLMSKSQAEKDDEVSDEEYDRFRTLLDSIPYAREGLKLLKVGIDFSKEELWLKILEAMNPEEKHVGVKDTEEAYWSYIINDGKIEEPTWGEWLRSWMPGYVKTYKYAGRLEAKTMEAARTRKAFEATLDAAATKEVNVQKAMEVRAEEEDDENTLNSSTCDQNIV